MSVTSSDIIVYGSANMPEADGTTSGGAIDLTTKIIFTDIVVTDTVDIYGEAGDGETVTVWGRDAAGSIVSEQETLDGTTPQTTTQTFERILKVVVSDATHGTINIERSTGSTAIATIETGFDELRRPFYGAAAEASSGSAIDLYEKIFIKNTHGSLALLNMEIDETADPGTSDILFDIEDAIDDNNSVADRKDTAPTGMAGSFSSSAKLLSTITSGATDLAAGEAIGVWLKLPLAAGQAAAKTTYTLTVTGSST